MHGSRPACQPPGPIRYRPRIAEIVVFHHALGLTEGIRGFADSLRAAGHVVHTPDLYGGRVFTDLDAGVAHAEDAGFDMLMERGAASVAGLLESLVYAGFSLGVLPAQRLAQTRAGARGALLYHSAVPAEMFGSWPPGVPLQVHLTADDPWAEEDLPAAEALRDESGAQLFVYPGSAHLFAEPAAPDHDPAAAGLLLERTLEFLAGLG